MIGQTFVLKYVTICMYVMLLVANTMSIFELPKNYQKVVRVPCRYDRADIKFKRISDRGCFCMGAKATARLCNSIVKASLVVQRERRRTWCAHGSMMI